MAFESASLPDRVLDRVTDPRLDARDARDACDSRLFNKGSFTCSIIADRRTALRFDRSASHADRSLDTASSFFF